MKKFITAFLAFCLVAVQLSSCSSTSDNDDAENQESSITEEINLDKTAEFNGISFQYPSSWEYVESDDCAYIYPPEGGLVTIMKSGDFVLEDSGQVSFDRLRSELDGFYRSFQNENGYKVESITNSFTNSAGILEYSDVTADIDGDSYSGSMSVMITNYHVYAIVGVSKTGSSSSSEEAVNSIVGRAVFPIDDGSILIEQNKGDVEQDEKSKQPAQEPEIKQQEPTLSQQNALKTADMYIETLPFSQSGLIEQLEYEGYSAEDSAWAASMCGADWNEEAAQCAENYLNTMTFSRDGLKNQLLYEGFTEEQAEFGLTSVGY